MNASELSAAPIRPILTPPQVQALLVREFAKVRPEACMACRAPRPFSGPSPNGHLYWYLPTPDHCAFGCHQRLVELWARITTEYRIGSPEKEIATWRGGVRVTTG